MHFPRKTIWIAVLVTAYTLLVPIARMGMHLEIGYNEGWNYYNALTVLHHQPLYAEAYGWHTVNYPAGSFFLSAWLWHLTGDLLFTGRALALLGQLATALFLGLIVLHLTRSRIVASFATILCISVLAASAPSYIGQYDPQLLATSFSLAGLYLYIRLGNAPAPLIGAALLFVLGGNLKHNLLDIPLAVVLDLLASRRPRALGLFLATAAVATGLSLYLNVHFGGPAFFSNLLAGRGYSVAHAFWISIGTLGPYIPLLFLAVHTAWRLRNNPQQRIAGLWFASAVVLNIFFAGGAGVATNALFDALLAMVLLLGLFSDRYVMTVPIEYALCAIAAWPLLPLFINNETSLPIRDIQQLERQQQTYRQSLAQMRSIGGPAICESLLLCAEAGKPYLYDPFNATRFIQLGKLDETPLLKQVRQHELSVIQLNKSIEETMVDTDAGRFTPELLEAIRANYHIAFLRPGTVLFLPNP